TVREGVGKFFLMGNEQDGLQVAAEILQFLDHHLSAGAIEAAEPFVDDDAFDGPELAAGVLADAEGERHGDAEALAAADEGDVDGGSAGGPVGTLQIERLVGARAVVAADDLQVKLAVAEAIEHAVGAIDDLALGLADQVPLQSVAAEQFGEPLVAVMLGVER